jgi:hypothetical protein
MGSFVFNICLFRSYLLRTQIRFALKRHSVEISEKWKHLAGRFYWLIGTLEEEPCPTKK